MVSLIFYTRAIIFYMPGVVDLLLYSTQQLGVMLAVGAQTIVLVAYLLSIRDGIFDSQEERFGHAVKKVLFVGIIFILISGAAITALEFFAGHEALVFAPAYLFKICLIGVLVFFSLVLRGNSLPEGVLEGLVGGTWYALFVVHILAPVAAWNQLIILYVVWIIGFMACWSFLLFVMRGKAAAFSDVVKAPSAQMPATSQPPPRPYMPPTPPVSARQKIQASAPLPKQTQSAPYVGVPLKTAPQPMPPTAQPPLLPRMSNPAPARTAQPPINLPTIRVMPRSPEALEQH